MIYGWNMYWYCNLKATYYNTHVDFRINSTTKMLFFNKEIIYLYNNTEKLFDDNKMVKF